MNCAIDGIGATYRDFVVTKHLDLSELKSTLFELVHEPSGARVIHIACDDPENLFCLSFQTIPNSSNGVAHILEHTVLCGSKKFPVKDPFFAMTRRSLNTYMNALTGQDFTCYPASSQVKKDFYNLLDVYLDAVFHPELKKTSFLQEGTRLELADHKLQFQGIVYNEMKGAMTSIESRLWQAISRRLTPDLTYAYNSGGDPKQIPELTYEELVEFHSNFYHPSRCLFFFYGDLPLSGHLDFILDQALKGVQKIPLLAPLPKQKRFTTPVIAKDYYPIAETEAQDKKTQVAFAWLTVPITEQAELLGLALLDGLLTDNDASPLKKALLSSGLCTQVESSLDAELSEVPWVIVCKGCEEKDADALQQLIFKTVAEVHFTQEEIDASLHQLEFQRIEINADGGPFGLSLFFRAALLKQHGSEPENGLLIHSLFNVLRARLKDPSYLPSLIQKTFLNNPHFVRLTFVADPNLSKKEESQEAERLAEIYKKLTEEQKEALQEQSKQLAAYQDAVENQSLDCLPKVTLHDVPKHVRDLKLEETAPHVFQHECFTNKVTYADLIFDLPELNKDELSLLALFARIVTDLGCGGRSYEENLAYQQAYTGSFDATIALHVGQDPDICRPSFGLRGKSLDKHRDKLFSLFADVVNGVDLTDHKRIEEWLQQHGTSLQNRLSSRALNYATQTALSGFSSSSFVYDQWNGLPYYKSALKWVAEGAPKMARRLKDLQRKILGFGSPDLVLSCEAMTPPKLLLPTHTGAGWKGNYPLHSVPSQVRLISSPVAFTASGLRTISYSHPDAPLLLLVTELLDNLVLHKEIREKGGAYGGGASYSPSTGNFHFFAYRDPHLAKTLAIFPKSLEAIAKAKFTEQELEEAKLGVIQSLDAPVPPSSRAMVAYAWLRAGRTLAMREVFRHTILSATKKQVAHAIEEHLMGKEMVTVSLLGKELYEKEAKKLKTPLQLIEI